MQALHTQFHAEEAGDGECRGWHDGKEIFVGSSVYDDDGCWVDDFAAQQQQCMSPVGSSSARTLAL
jgi:hypothetical protein